VGFATHSRPARVRIISCIMFNDRGPAAPHPHMPLQPPPGRGHLPPRTPVPGGARGAQGCAPFALSTAPCGLTECDT
ncbi:hypothetical protein, partial [Citrobacter sp. wls619]|uniref:hypothetical protein n=1 Tax=Citrobacter sp. wls619 TaxID=2576432 RepID=UPI001BAF52C2